MPTWGPGVTCGPQTFPRDPTQDLTYWKLSCLWGGFTPTKTNGWIPKMMGLGKIFSPLEYGHFLVSFQICFFNTPKIGEDEPTLTCAYLSDGLVQPPTSWGVFQDFGHPSGGPKNSHLWQVDVSEWLHLEAGAGARWNSTHERHFFKILQWRYVEQTMFIHFLGRKWKSLFTILYWFDFASYVPVGIHICMYLDTFCLLSTALVDATTTQQIWINGFLQLQLHC